MEPTTKPSVSSYFITLLILIGLAIVGWTFWPKPQPTAEQVTPKLRLFLLSDPRCIGKVTVDHLSDVSIGRYSSDLGGWPVYASHQETCKSPATEYTTNGLDTPAQHAAVAFVRRAGRSDFEVYMPEAYSAVMTDIQNNINNTVNSVNTKINNARCYTNDRGNFVCE